MHHNLQEKKLPEVRSNNVNLTKKIQKLTKKLQITDSTTKNNLIKQDFVKTFANQVLIVNNQ